MINYSFSIANFEYFLLIPVIWMSMHFQKQKRLEILRYLINQ